MIGRVHVNTRVGAIVFQYPADAFHGVAVKSKVVNIYSVDAYILGQPVQPFHIEVVPT